MEDCKIMLLVSLSIAVFVVGFTVLGRLLPSLPEPWRSYLANEEPPKEGG